jgi:hypothetical protein
MQTSQSTIMQYRYLSHSQTYRDSLLAPIQPIGSRLWLGLGMAKIGYLPYFTMPPCDSSN